MENNAFSFLKVYSETENCDNQRKRSEESILEIQHGHGIEFSTDRESNYITAFHTDFGDDFQQDSKSVISPSTTRQGSSQNVNEGHVESSKSEIIQLQYQKSWLLLLKEYTAKSTFHGLYHMVASQPFILRRLLWLLLFLACTALLVIQITSNIAYYISWPMYIDVRIHYNDSILFPAVTICNQNAFRSTVTYNMSMHGVVSSLYSESTRDHNRTEHVTALKENRAGNMTLDTLYYMAGHSAKDLIFSCEWHGSECTHADFTPTLTDAGLCYTFNGLHADTDRRKTLQSGSEGGLRLHLNIEQYEYMKGPNTGAGLKLQVHNPDEPPLVRDQGIAIPPGSQALVAVRTSEIHKLKKPHGKCNDSVDLDFYSDYTMSTCKINCKQKYVLKHCGCRDIYMSSLSDTQVPDSGVCTLDEYIDCLKPALPTFGTLSGHMCDCPVSCYHVAYETRVSYATTSSYDIDSLRYNTPTVASIHKRYVHARDVQQRVTESIVESDLTMIMKLNESVFAVKEMMKQIQDQLPIDRMTMERMFKNMQRRLYFHKEKALDNVLYTIEHDFIRGWNVFKERSFVFVTQDYFDLSLQFKRALQDSSPLVENHTETSRRLLTRPIINMAEGRLECIRRAYDYLSETQEGYYDGVPLVTYKTTYNRHYDLSYIPKEILRTGLYKSYEQYDKIRFALGQISDGLNMLINMCEDFALTGIFDESVYDEAENLIGRGSRSYNYRLFMYETRLVTRPLEKMNEIIQHFELINRTFVLDYYDNLRTTIELQDYIQDFMNSHFIQLTNFNTKTTDYLNNRTYMKSVLSRIASSVDMQELPGFLSVFFSDLRDRLYGLQQHLTQMSLSYKAVWKAMVEEETTAVFYQHIHSDSLAFLSANSSDSTLDEPYLWRLFASMLDMEETAVRSYSKQEIVEFMNADFFTVDIEEKVFDIEQIFTNFIDNVEASKIIQYTDEHLMICLTEWTDSLQEFTEHNQLDSVFYRENFMRLDVYMQELSYEEIRQEASYESSQLLSDIGGSVGLFIGGSVMSLFELLDVFVHNAIRRMLNR